MYGRKLGSCLSSLYSVSTATQSQLTYDVLVQPSFPISPHFLLESKCLCEINRQLRPVNWNYSKLEQTFSESICCSVIFLQNNHPYPSRNFFLLCIQKIKTKRSHHYSLIKQGMKQILLRCELNWHYDPFLLNYHLKEHELATNNTSMYQVTSSFKQSKKLMGHHSSILETVNHNSPWKLAVSSNDML